MIERIKKIYLFAAIYGLLALVPQFFLLEKTGRDFPPPVTHPEYYFGFIEVAIAWQIMFILISRDPVRYRPAMLVTVIEKAPFGLTTIILYLQGKLSGQMLAAGCIDLFLMCLFIYSYLNTPKG